MDEAVVIELSSERLEVMSIEILRKKLVCECLHGIEHQQSAPPLDNPLTSFLSEHRMKSADKFRQTGRIMKLDEVG